MSAKNTVQEIYQKDGLEVPKYTTNRVGGEDHCPTFTSSIMTSTGILIIGSPATSKKKAELNTAEKLLMFLSEKDQSVDNLQRIHHYNITVFVDLENLPNAPKEILAVHDVKIVGFVSRRHPIASNPMQCGGGVHIIVANTTVKDGADIWMAMHIADVVSDGDTIIVLTKDHFGEAVCQYVNNYEYLNDVEAHYKVSSKEVIEFLEQMA